MIAIFSLNSQVLILKYLLQDSTLWEFKEFKELINKTRIRRISTAITNKSNHKLLSLFCYRGILQQWLD